MDARPYRLLPTKLHAYSLYAYIAYPLLLFVYINRYEQLLGSEEYSFILVIGTCAFHALLFLVTQWSLSLRMLFTARSVGSLSEATHMLVPQSSENNRGEVCRLLRDKTGALYFEYQKTKYYYEEDKKDFRKIQYPTHMSHGQYAAASGLKSAEEIDMTVDRFGLNIFDIPLPKFKELFKEHAVAPFFVFQVFCVCLWFMDEYWYYSLFTLAMLFIFESTVVFQRLRNLKELRSMAQQPYDITVRRGNRWQTIKTDRLMPGDVVSVVRAKTDDITVPCDLLLLSGSCIINEAMLSGESTPLLKESIELLPAEETFDLRSPDSKGNVLFGGTKVLQATGPDSSNPAPGNGLFAPDGGCIGYVLRTGFGTVQGRLVRTMVYSAERVSANNWESLLFILFLMVFAIASAVNVWQTGLASGRKKGKLLLDCILIVTSVIPPELPMELSLAVNQSLIALSKLAIFCVEPFRIPFAGKLDILCFDKTGTLTAEKLEFEGVAGIRSKKEKLRKPKDLPPETIMAMASCHSLMHLDSGVVGDPMEKALLNSVDWDVGKGDVVAPRDASLSGQVQSKIIKKFAFSSQLKRMATVCAININDSFLSKNRKSSDASASDPSFSPAPQLTSMNSNSSGKYFVAVKGAPETLRKMFSQNSLPSNYDETYTHFAMNGSRVIALGWRLIDIAEVEAKRQQAGKPSVGREQSLREMDRELAEKGLTFAGFLVFHCPLKPDTVESIIELHESMHRIIMITGDNPLTACHISRELWIIRRPAIILDVPEDSKVEKVIWKTVDDSLTFITPDDWLDKDHVNDEMQRLFSRYDLCITGKALEKFYNSPFYTQILLPRIFVYARASPVQKEYVLASMKKAGYTTLMCGDGTNDVGALKQAHIGVALLDGTKEDLEKIAKGFRERRLKEIREKQEEMMKAWGVKLPEESQRRGQQQQNRQMNKLMETMQDVDDIPVLKFGDASVAAPFTSKLGSISSSRCTLVTTIQMYKILALNSLISAFSLSALYLDGIRYGDTQMTLQGFLLAGCFLFLSWAKPIQRLSKERPQPNIFNWYILLSVLGQFAVHVTALWYVVREIKWFLPPDWKPDLDSTKFEPNILNSAVYLISLSMQVSTFLINYQGRPFRESLRENRPLYLSLSALFGIAVFAAAEVMPELNEWVEIVPLPGRFSEKLVTAILLDFGVSWLIEQTTKSLFANHKPLRSLRLDDDEWQALGLEMSETAVKTPRFSMS